MGMQELVRKLGHSSWSYFQVDVRNAFNTQRRAVFLGAAQMSAPSTYNFL